MNLPAIQPKLRNTREVVALRLAAREREQIARAATSQKLTLSAFLRQATLQASAIVEKKATVKAPEPEAPAHEPVLLLRSEGHQHHWVDGICRGCGQDVDDVELWWH